MINYKVVYTLDGRRRVTLANYDKGTADEQVEELRGKGATDIEIVTVKPGETFAVEQPRRIRIVERRHTTRGTA